VSIDRCRPADPPSYDFERSSQRLPSGQRSIAGHGPTLMLDNSTVTHPLPCRRRTARFGSAPLQVTAAPSGQPSCRPFRSASIAAAGCRRGCVARTGLLPTVQVGLHCGATATSARDSSHVLLPTVQVGLHCGSRIVGVMPSIATLADRSGRPPLRPPPSASASSPACSSCRPFRSASIAAGSAASS
jgi:hypothetical protein